MGGDVVKTSNAVVTPDGHPLDFLDRALRLAVDAFRAAGNDPTDAFRGLYVDDLEADAMLGELLGAAGDRETTGDDAGPDDRAAGGDDTGTHGGSGPWTTMLAHRLGHLVERFGLQPFERNVLLAAAAPDLDLRYGRLFAFLHDDVQRRRLSPDLAMRLLCRSPEERATARETFAATASLRRFSLLVVKDPSCDETTPLLSASLQPDERVVAYLLGSDGPDARLLPYILPDQGPTLQPTSMAEALLDRARHIAHALWETPAERVVVVAGHAGSDRVEAATRVAAHLGLTLLAVDTPRVAAEAAPERLVDDRVS